MSYFFRKMDTPAMAGWLDIGDRPFPLIGKSISLGRAKDNNVVFASTKVSRRHALIHAQGGGEFSLVDLGSSNGTHHNGRRVIQPVALQDGDKIQVGEQSLTFRLEALQSVLDESNPTETQLTVREIKEMACWFLLLDIKNFVRLSTSLPTAEMAQMVGAWMAECQQMIERHGGILSKFLGDGMLIYWDKRSTDAAQVAAALQAVRAIQARRQPAFRWALHLGKAVFGAAAAPGEVSTLGQDVNFLFRLERVAAANDFSSTMSETAYTQIGSLLGASSLGSFPIKGLEGDHAVFGCAA